MDERINAFLDKLKLGLAGLPESETEEALNYYKEYLQDALDDGKSVEELLSRLDAPEKTAAMIKADTSIRKARKSPGLGNYHRVLKYARANLSKPFSVLLFSIFIFATYSTAVILLCGAIAAGAGGAAILAGFIYEAVKIPGTFAAEITGTICIGLFAALLCLLAAFGLYRLFRLFIKISSGLVGRMLKKSRRQIPEIVETPAGKKASPVSFVKICAAIAAASLIIALATGLPVKLFMIFNSMSPLKTTTRVWEYDISDISQVSVTTAQSHILVEKAKDGSGKIKIEYEQPDWLEPETDTDGGRLVFKEISNGRLPLFPLVSLHENRTNVTVTLPEGFDPSGLELESRGGFVYINAADFNTRVKTYTGNIFIESGNTNITAVTSSGAIFAEGSKAGAAGSAVKTWAISSQSDIKIDLETARGNIYINYR